MFGEVNNVGLGLFLPRRRADGEPYSSRVVTEDLVFTGPGVARVLRHLMQPWQQEYGIVDLHDARYSWVPTDRNISCKLFRAQHSQDAYTHTLVQTTPGHAPRFVYEKPMKPGQCPLSHTHTHTHTYTHTPVPTHTHTHTHTHNTGSEITICYSQRLRDEAADTQPSTAPHTSQESITCSGSSCEFLGGGGIRTEKLRLRQLEARVTRLDGIDVREDLAFKIGEEPEEECDESGAEESEEDS